MAQTMSSGSLSHSPKSLTASSCSMKALMIFSTDACCPLHEAELPFPVIEAIVGGARGWQLGGRGWSWVAVGGDTEGPLRNGGDV
eukprot:2285346-Prymnesium_polylepis.1